MNSSNSTHYFANVKSYYDQNPNKAHMAAGFAAVTTGATSMVSWLGGRPMPKIAKVTVLGLTFISNLAALNMQNPSMKELAKVALTGKNIVDDTIEAVKAIMSELYDYVVEEEQANETDNTMKINLTNNREIAVASSVTENPTETPVVEILGNNGEDLAV